MPFKTIDPATLKTWLEHDEALLIDVREPAEHAAASIDGAHLMPVSQVSASALPPREHRMLVIHCLKGARGEAACRALKAQGLTEDIYNLEGGISAWEAAGLDIVRPVAGRKVLPLDRQTQLVIGISLILSSTLSLIVHPLVALVPAALGLGLTVAGLTGFCGLARVLAVIPLNAS